MGDLSGKKMNRRKGGGISFGRYQKRSSPMIDIMLPDLSPITQGPYSNAVQQHSLFQVDSRDIDDDVLEENERPHVDRLSKTLYSAAHSDQLSNHSCRDTDDGGARLHSPDQLEDSKDPITIMQFLEQGFRCVNSTSIPICNRQEQGKGIKGNPDRLESWGSSDSARDNRQRARQIAIFEEGIQTILSVMRQWPDSANSQSKACSLLQDFSVESTIFTDIAIKRDAIITVQRFALRRFPKHTLVQLHACQALERLLTFSTDPAAAAAQIDDRLILNSMRQFATSAPLQATTCGILSVTSVNPKNATRIVEAGGLEILCKAYRTFRDSRSADHRDIRGHVRCTVPRLLLVDEIQERSHSLCYSSHERNAQHQS